MSKSKLYVTDTHVLAWFISEDQRLSPKAQEILTKAELGEVQVLIPTLVLAELTHIAEKRRVNLTIETLLTQIDKGNGFTVVAFDFAVFHYMLQFPQDWDIHDRIIAATSSYYQAVLITRDNVLRNYSHLETIW